MPRRAAWPVPTMMAVGVASPSAQGQAISSTATACASAREAGWPASSQPASVSARDAAHRRHEARRDAVGELLHRQLGALRVVDQLDDAGQHGVAADGGDAHDEAAVAVEAAADHRVAGALGHRQRFAGEHGFVEC